MKKPYSPPPRRVEKQTLRRLADEELVDDPRALVSPRMAVEQKLERAENRGRKPLEVEP